MVEHDSIIPPGREGKVTQKIALGSGHHGLVKKYVTVISNAKNHPELRLSLACTIRSELEIEPPYLSLRPDKNGLIRQSLTITTPKKDLKVLEFSFKENAKSNDLKGTNWQTALPLQFKTELTGTDSTDAEGYLKYRLDISLSLKDNAAAYGQFILKTNNPKKNEVVLTGVILEQEK